MDKLGLRDHVVFPGYVDDEEIPAFYNLADLFVLPSFYEGFGIPVLEAMAFSKPCVVTDVGGNPEIVTHGETGLVTPSENTEAFTQAIAQLIEDNALAQRMGKAARERYENNFTVKSMAESYQRIYRKIGHHQ